MNGLALISVRKYEPLLRDMMARHYSAPKGFPGRDLKYRVEYDGVPYGYIVAGGAGLHLAGRDGHPSDSESFTRWARSTRLMARRSFFTSSATSAFARSRACSRGPRKPWP